MRNDVIKRANQKPADKLPPLHWKWLQNFFSQTGWFLIGGIDTAKLTLASPDEVRQMVLDLEKKMKNCSGFTISSCGGLHGNIPLANLEAYFDARVEIGAISEDWRSQYKI